MLRGWCARAAISSLMTRVGRDGLAPSEAVSWVWSATHGRVLRGHQVVLLVWTDGRMRVPVGMRLWRRGGDSKVELAAQLLREAQRRGIKPKYVLFASWYAGAALLHLLENLGWKYVARFTSNRSFEGATVRAPWPHRFGGRWVGDAKLSTRSVSSRTGDAAL